MNELSSHHHSSMNGTILTDTYLILSNVTSSSLTSENLLDRGLDRYNGILESTIRVVVVVVKFLFIFGSAVSSLDDDVLAAPMTKV